MTSNLNLRYFILCSSAKRGPDNKLSCEGFFDSWSVESFPTKLDRFHIVLGIDGVKSGDKTSLALSIKKPDGSYLLEHKFVTKSSSDISPILYIASLNEFPVNREGIFVFEVHHKNHVIGRYPLSINLRREES